MLGRLRLAAGVSLLVAAASPCLVAQTLPAGFRDSVVFSGLTQPTAVAFSPDGRVFVAEKSGLIKVFASLTRHDADASSPTSRRRSTTTGTAACSAWRSIPAFPDHALRLRSLHLRRRHRRPAPRSGARRDVLSDPCPTPPGGDDRRLHRERTALAADRRPASVMTGTRSRSSSTTGSSSSRAIRSAPSSSAPTARSTRAAATARASTGPTTARRAIPKNPGGDPPVGVGGVQTPPTAEGGALRSQDLRTRGRPA